MRHTFHLESSSLLRDLVFIVQGGEGGRIPWFRVQRREGPFFFEPQEGFLTEGADLDVWRGEEDTTGKGTRVSKSMEVPRCGWVFRTTSQDCLGNETGRNGQGP